MFEVTQKWQICNLDLFCLSIFLIKKNKEKDASLFKKKTTTKNPVNNIVKCGHNLLHIHVKVIVAMQSKYHKTFYCIVQLLRTK